MTRGKYLECAKCGTEFYARPSLQESRKYCSPRCFFESKKQFSVCAICGEEFYTRSKIVKSCKKKECRAEIRSRAKKGKKHPLYDNGRATNRDRWNTQKEKRCRMCGESRKALKLHHVVYAQHVRKRGGDVWDPRNSFTVCVSCHNRHHNGTDERIPVSMLRPENREFANELLGDYADDYFKRFYEDGWLQSVFG